MATYADMEELIRLRGLSGRFQPGGGRADQFADRWRRFCASPRTRSASLGDGYRQLAQILSNLETER